MDVEFWTARVNSAKNVTAVQSTHFRNSDSQTNVDKEGEEDDKAWFPCPFCYIEIEVPILCSHVQEEHCLDLKNAVCPICAATLGKDPTGHFVVQHAQSVKRRRKPGFWNNAMIRKDPGERTSYFDRNSGQGTAPDPLLLPFLCNVLPKSRQQDKSVTTEIQSKLLESDPALEEHFEEKRQRATFLQELVASTIF